MGYIVNDSAAGRSGSGGVSCGMQEVMPESGAESPSTESVPVVIPDAKTKPHDTRRDFERFLRDAGYSRADAKRIAAHGFDAPENDGREQLMALLRRNLEMMKEHDNV